MSIKFNSRKADLEYEKHAPSIFAQEIGEAIRKASGIIHWGDGEGGYLRELFEYELGIVINRSKRHASCQPIKTYRKRKLSPSLKKRILERDGYRCQTCSTHLDLTIDHIVPEVKGGSDEDGNLQTLCRSCNSKKGIK